MVRYESLPPMGSSDTATFAARATKLLRANYKTGFRYINAGERPMGVLDTTHGKRDRGTLGIGFGDVKQRRDLAMIRVNLSPA